MHLTLFLVLATIFIRGFGEPICNVFDLSITASALNLQLPTGLDIGLLTPSEYAALANLPTVNVSGTYTISARYCEPEVYVASRCNNLQVLVHGVTYTKDYWSGLGPPGQGIDGDTYSWVAYASKQGYPTLAFDRICNGNSSHPNGLLACQVPLNTEILNSIIELAGSGGIDGRNFTNVIPICHSEGSVICQYLMQTHPDAARTQILTGFTNHLIFGAPGSYLAGRFVPANIGRPDAYANILDPTYQVATSQRGVTGFFYFGNYSTAVATFDFNNRGPLTLGELATAPLSQLPAPDYTGSLYVLNGQEDQIFCAILPTDPLIGFRGQCGQGASSFSAQTAALFPNAKSYKWDQIQETGHTMDLHNTAYETFQAAHQYLASQGY